MARLPNLLSHLFLHFLPSLLLAVLALFLSETARLMKCAADALQSSTPTDQQSSPPPSPSESSTPPPLPSSYTLTIPSRRHSSDEGPASPNLSPTLPNNTTKPLQGTPPSPTLFKMTHLPLATNSLDFSKPSTFSGTPQSLPDTFPEAPAREFVRMNNMMRVSSAKKSADERNTHIHDLQPEISEDVRHENIPEELEIFPTSLSEKFSNLGSPESPIQRARQGKWRASDHDLFSEDPMARHEGYEQGELDPDPDPNPDRLHNRSSSYKSSPPPIPDAVRLRQTLVEDYDSAAMIVGVRCVDTDNSWFNEDTFSASTPVTNPYADRSDWSSDSSTIQVSIGMDKTHATSSNSSDSLLTKEPSIDILVNSPVLDDRPRGSRDADRQLGPRCITCRMPAKHGVTTKHGRPLPNPRVGRSLSSGENRGDEWPEYNVSAQDDATRMGRRHASDMSFGVKARKQDMLPAEVLNAQMDRHVHEQLGERGRGWKKRFGLTAGREANDMKLAFRNILRRRRRPLPVDGDAPRLGTSQRIAERSCRRGVNEGDIRFESEFALDVVFPLLNRICSETGYSVAVKRPNYKMKIEIPCGDSNCILLMSVNLTRMSHGRGTIVTMARSKDDDFHAPPRDVEEAAAEIRKRLAAHVEVLEDSFASLYFDDSMIELNESRVVIED